MEEIQSSFHRAIAQARDSNLCSTVLSSFNKAKASINSSLSSSSSSSNAIPTDMPPPLLIRAPGKMLSIWTCSKLCCVFFIAGVYFGYSLKRRSQRWASKLLKRLKDD